jgi:lactoylglutathione lyase
VTPVTLSGRASAFERSNTPANAPEPTIAGVIRNGNGIEFNLIFNANAGDLSTNVLMDAPDKYPGYTHIALRVASIPSAIAALKANEIAITQGPVSFGDSGQASVFIRDPDCNVVELRGRDQGPIEGVTRYVP